MNRTLASLFLVAAALFGLDTFAQSTGALQQIAAPPRLVVPPGNHRPIELQSLAVRTRADGRQVATEWAFAFFNPNPRVMEGELQFPLLDGQSIANFALEVNGQLREAVPVEKAKGQQVFEDVIRQRIDPGLLSHTQGNNFKLRVYPIPANGVKRVVVRIDDRFTEANGIRTLRLPLQLGQRVAHFELDVQVRGNAVPRSTSGLLATTPFERTKDGHRLLLRRDEVQLNETMDFSMKAARETTVTTASFDGAGYFHADVPIDVQSAPRALPHRIALVWDASGSANLRDHGREFALLDGYFRRMGSGRVSLIVVRDVAEPARSFTIANGQWRDLRATLEKLAEDGATNLAAAGRALAADTDSAEALLFSDGLGNYGVNGGERWPTLKIPLHTISSAPKADPAWLRHVAERSGGRFLDLTASTSSAALAQLITATTRLIRAEGEGLSEIATASPHPAGGYLSIAGKLSMRATQLLLTLADPGGRERALRLAVAPSSTANSGTVDAGAARHWARLTLAGLDAEHDLNRAQIRRFGQRFGLVTRETSLIVLDRVEDYARNEIEPPAELMAEYRRLIAAGVAQKTADRKAHLERIVRMFNDKVTWWNREFPKQKDVQEQKIAAARGDLAMRQERDARNMASPPPALSAPAAPAAASPVQSRADSPIPREMSANAAAPSLRAGAAAKQQVDSLGVRGLDSASIPTSTEATIRLQSWRPDSPYAARYRETATPDLYRVYLDEKPGYPASTAFFLDSADALFERGLTDLGLRVLSNLAEMDLENRHVLRVLGYRLLQAKAPALAISVLKKVLVLSPEEPQSTRDLGLAYAANNEAQRAIDSLYETVSHPWHGRFPEVELIALSELNAIAATATGPLDTSRIDPRLLKNLPLDLRVVLTWDADNTDIDLHVTDPNGEKAYYGNRLTRQGGRMSLDFTGGYGPEEFSLKKALPGKYKVEANYFGDRRQNAAGPTTLQVRFSTHFGLANQKDEIVTLRLKGNSETVFVGEFEVK